MSGRGQQPDASVPPPDAPAARPMTAKPAATIKDVATLAGVSVGTVSNVLNHPMAVSDKNRAKVDVAIAKLGYVPNEAARQLRTSR